MNLKQALINVYQGCWCPLCKNKTEKYLYEYIKTKYPETIHQADFQWAVNPLTGKTLIFDILIESHKIIIEMDGPQHFRQISNWETPENILYRDIVKEIGAFENGYTVIRLLQEDVKFKKCLYWKKFLDIAIAKTLEREKPWLLRIERGMLLETDREHSLNFILENDS